MKIVENCAAQLGQHPATFHLTETQLAQRWQLSVKTLQANRWKGIGCNHVKLGRLVRYRMEDVVAYESAHLVMSMGGH